jgi:FMN phosphatase YigB (HAD superfamily)
MCRYYITMIRALLSDFSRVLVSATITVPSLNRHHRELKSTPDYRFSDHFFLNDRLLAYYEELSATIPIYIATTGALHELAEVKPHLSMVTKVFTGLAKSDPATYTDLAAALSLLPREIIFIDDQLVNVTAAHEAGLHAIQYTDNATVISEVSRLLLRP